MNSSRISIRHHIAFIVIAIAIALIASVAALPHNNEDVIYGHNSNETASYNCTNGTASMRSAKNDTQFAETLPGLVNSSDKAKNATAKPKPLNGQSNGSNSNSGGTFTGQATYYAANGGTGGSCELPNSGADVVALNAPQYAAPFGKGQYCGKCVSITGARGTAVARVVDKCPGCKSGDLDLSEELFPKIDDPAKGRVSISWSFVDC